MDIICDKKWELSVIEAEIIRDKNVQIICDKRRKSPIRNTFWQMAHSSQEPTNVEKGRVKRPEHICRNISRRRNMKTNHLFRVR